MRILYQFGNYNNDNNCNCTVINCSIDCDYANVFVCVSCRNLFIISNLIIAMDESMQDIMIIRRVVEGRMKHPEKSNSTTFWDNCASELVKFHGVSVLLLTVLEVYGSNPAITKKKKKNCIPRYSNILVVSYDKDF